MAIRKSKKSILHKKKKSRFGMSARKYRKKFLFAILGIKFHFSVTITRKGQQKKQNRKREFFYVNKKNGWHPITQGLYNDIECRR